MSSALRLADRLLDALGRELLLPRTFNWENRARAILVAELEKIEREECRPVETPQEPDPWLR